MQKISWWDWPEQVVAERLESMMSKDLSALLQNTFLINKSKMTEKVSVIVPVYNVEKYLRQCLDSILQQTYQNLEILIINDGSTDGSDAICREYLEKMNEYPTLQKENTGISDTRNVGIRQATGEYVTFVDSDDWIEKTYIEELYDKLITYHADIVAANYYLFNDAESLFYFFMGSRIIMSASTPLYS